MLFRANKFVKIFKIKLYFYHYKMFRCSTLKYPRQSSSLGHRWHTNLKAQSHSSICDRKREYFNNSAKGSNKCCDLSYSLRLSSVIVPRVGWPISSHMIDMSWELQNRMRSHWSELGHVVSVMTGIGWHDWRVMVCNDTYWRGREPFNW